MKTYADMTREELLSIKAELEEQFKTEEAKGHSFNMARGKPGVSQLVLSMPMLSVINDESDMNTVLGNDTRNYGDWDGIGECRRMMAGMLGVKKDNVIVCGNSSLMFNQIHIRAVVFQRYVYHFYIKDFCYFKMSVISRHRT